MSTAHRHPKVTVAGEVDYPHTVDLRDLAEVEDEEVSIDFYCHEGWSRLGQSYRGVALRTLLRLASARPAARYVTVASGGYSVVLTREQAEDERVLLAFEHDGAPLAGPRLVGPSEWDCFLSVKHVDRIELTRPHSGRRARRLRSPGSDSSHSWGRAAVASSHVAFRTTEDHDVNLPSMPWSSWAGVTEGLNAFALRLVGPR